MLEVERASKALILDWTPAGGSGVIMVAAFRVFDAARRGVEEAEDVVEAVEGSSDNSVMRPPASIQLVRAVSGHVCRVSSR